jgi:hypothetical protein
MLVLKTVGDKQESMVSMVCNETESAIILTAVLKIAKQLHGMEAITVFQILDVLKESEIISLQDIPTFTSKFSEYVAQEQIVPVSEYYPNQTVLLTKTAIDSLRLLKSISDTNGNISKIKLSEYLESQIKSILTYDPNVFFNPDRFIDGLEQLIKCKRVSEDATTLTIVSNSKKSEVK